MSMRIIPLIIVVILISFIAFRYFVRNEIELPKGEEIKKETIVIENGEAIDTAEEVQVSDQKTEEEAVIESAPTATIAEQGKIEEKVQEAGLRTTKRDYDYRWR